MTSALILRQFRAAAFLPTAMLWLATLICSHTAGAQAPQGSLADRLKAVQSGHEGPPPPTLAVWSPVSSTTSSMIIPLVKGLIVSGAMAGDDGDQEQIRSITDVTAAAVTLEVEWDKPGPIAGQPPTRIVTTRIVDRADLATAHRFMVYFHNGEREHYPGSTGFGTSTEVINQLRAGRLTELLLEAYPDPKMTMYTLMQAKTELVGWNGNPMYKCNLHRVGTADVATPMLVNGERVDLPAIHGSCMIGRNEVHLYFLDQPSNPLLLASQGVRGISQMVKIDFPPTSPEGQSRMERALAAKKPVDVYGIYFDFNSATIKPESAAVLRQIVAILHKHPHWKLSVSGFTDNIGTDEANLLLSRRRAAAVKKALVSRYKIAPERLATSGYGASSPIESNATLEGRARNRRVELQRQ